MAIPLPDKKKLTLSERIFKRKVIFVLIVMLPTAYIFQSYMMHKSKRKLFQGELANFQAVKSQGSALNQPTATADPNHQPRFGETYIRR